jgi:hypothetical protein
MSRLLNEVNQWAGWKSLGSMAVGSSDWDERIKLRFGKFSESDQNFVLV